MAKPASSKRASPPRSSDSTKAFRADWERLTRGAKHNMKQLKEVMMLLIANDAPLPPEWLDHPLNGEWKDHRECHVGGDFLLIYLLQGKGDKEGIVFVRAGTHSELF